MMFGEEKYEVVPSKNFFKELSKLSTEDQDRVKEVLDIMRIDPFYLSLRTKKVHKLFESSVNMDIRIFWRFRGSQIIAALNVGHHDVIRKYNKHKF
jgi:mRNA-degrading endonuclease RelE of RelBE toxin-antitoxin system